MIDEEEKLLSTIRMKSACYGADITWKQALQYIDKLRTENASLHEKLSRSVELPVPLGTPILHVWKNRVQEDYPFMEFYDLWVISEEKFTIDDLPRWGKFYFPNTIEGKKAAQAQRDKLQNGEK